YFIALSPNRDLTLAIFGLQHCPCVRGDERIEREISVWRQRNVIGNFDEGSERAYGADVGQQKAALVFHGRVGLREIGQIEDRHAQEIERRILEIDLLLELIMNDPRRADFPQRHALALFLTDRARRERRAMRDGEAALTPLPAGGGEAAGLTDQGGEA